MQDAIALRVTEICSGEWVVQFEGGPNGWTTFSDTFDNPTDAQTFMQEQIDSADLGTE
jgi:hypothetical protein